MMPPALAAYPGQPQLIDSRLPRRGGIFRFKQRGTQGGRTGYASGPVPFKIDAAGMKCTPQGSGALQWYGGPTINEITYKIIFVGTIWTSTKLNPAIKYIDSRLCSATQDDRLNLVLHQYFEQGKAVTASAKRPFVLPYPWKSEVGEPEIFNMIQSLAQTDPDFPSSDIDLRNFAYLFVLPPGTILNGPSNLLNQENSLEGLGGYHDWYLMPNGSKVSRVYFGAVVWADGQNGAAVPDWDPCDNVCAGLYHELAEIRLNPNIDDPNVCDWGWVSEDGAEICDLVIDSVLPNIKAAFRLWQLDLKRPVEPVQLLWTNCDGIDGKGMMWNPLGDAPTCTCLKC
jgi:hypothetical protein